MANPMDMEISWQVELMIKPGKLDEFQSLTCQMVESARHEPGVLIYERFLNEDGTVAYVYERYVDSASAVAHIVEFKDKYGVQFANLVERKYFRVFGAPSQDLKKLLNDFGATYPNRLDGFSRVFQR